MQNWIAALGLYRIVQALALIALALIVLSIVLWLAAGGSISFSPFG